MEEVKRFVKVNAGMGTATQEIEYVEGDTVASVLERAGVEILAGQRATLGKVDVAEPANTPVEPGDVIVVANAPKNGAF